ncbi:uncharacterized protein YhjY with autotransporter beta-barrel domain [Polynucleobacter sphagniphilus]|uniref:autotransporter outer membrane beta-barrel domain-containing protein n=1 Tax=Polynucleobacter sphagniphilus TaxID=1743169 RepID=UPI002472FD45|nr:autotransporter outer membrane beta-barrel domain-containing protein [Polynucleobacter sphagniphilus]MDH6241567.1 uncharacterized protein YhjY with autotransporter beta-barrel domain [Polynucleobacter sphagniphilus]
MKLFNIKNIALSISLAFLVIVDVSAQTCSGGTTTVNSITNSPLYLNDSNSCGYISSSGSVTFVSAEGMMSDIDGVIIRNNGVIGSSITYDYAGQVGIEIGGGIAQTSIASLVNAASINVSLNGINPYVWGIRNFDTIIALTNSGSIITSANGANAYSIGIENNGAITSLTNSGSITSYTSGINSFGFGIANNGTIDALNNAQGGNRSSLPTTALTYTGALPTNYNIIITSPTHYGQLAVTGGSGTTTFGIYGGGAAGIAASILSKGTYSAVLSGVAASNIIGATKGAYGGLNWTLSEVNLTGGIWDLIVNGATVADTQQSLVNTASALQNTFTLQNNVLANSFSYDCNIFGENDVCVSAGGRNTAVSAANGLNNTSALLIAAYRVMPSVRVGAYADQNLSVNNAGSTVNLGNNTPLIGLFGAWNERLDGTGTEVKVSAAYGQKNTTVTRQVVGTSEAGSGSSQLNSQGAQVAAKYGFGVVENVIVSPYVGVRYTQNNMNGYTEAASSTVTAPLTYSALNTNATTALAGVGAQYKFIPQATAFASVGVETDTNTSNGTYSATGITGLTPINFNANPVKTRPTAMLGASYDVEKNQRLGVTGIYRQEAYQATASTTVMATYTVGF